jgi:hypothetical protein
VSGGRLNGLSLLNDCHTSDHGCHTEREIILALRNPADLVVSYHRTQVVALNEDLANFDMAWQRSLAGSAPAVKPLDDKLVDYPHVGSLGSAVDRLLQYVPRQQIHVVLFEDLQQRPQPCLATTLSIPRVVARPRAHIHSSQSEY